MRTTCCLWLAISAAGLLAGCSIVLDFDRSQLPDASVEDAGEGGAGGVGGRGGSVGAPATGRSAG